MGMRRHFSVGGCLNCRWLRPGAALRVVAALSALPAVSFGASQPVVAGEFRPGGLEVGEARARLGTSDAPVPGCLPAGDAHNDLESTVDGELARILGVLRHSETATALLEVAQARRVHVCLDGATRLLAYYFDGARVIGLNASLTDAGKILFLAHELGHVPQHPLYSDNRYFAPGDLILLRRVREATAEALATCIAWELRVAGYPEVWREKVSTHYGDVARAFEDAVSAEAPGPASSRQRGLDGATRAAFDRWFVADWRRRVYDRMTVEHLEHISGDAMGLVPARRFLSHDFLLGIGRIGAGNFLARTDGPPLDDPAYAGAMAPEIEGRLRRVLEQKHVSDAPGADKAILGVDS